MIIINMIRGFCMALADSVPGVSGGTIAFLLGFYDQFITSLDNLVSGSKKERLDAVLFLLKLGLGWVIGFIAAVLVLTSVFVSHIYAVSSLFIGFIIFSIPFVALEEKETIRAGKLWHLIFILIGVLIVVAVTYFNPVSGSGDSINLGHLNFGLCIYVFVVAMIAISAMILPGISGSSLLLIFGLYVPILNAIRSVLSLNFKYLPVLIIFSLGMLAGIALVIKLIRMTLEKFRPQMIYLIIGLMIGSLYAIVMGPTTLDTPQPAMIAGTFSILFFIIGGIVIVGLQMLKKLMEK